MIENNNTVFEEAYQSITEKNEFADFELLKKGLGGKTSGSVKVSTTAHKGTKLQVGKNFVILRADGKYSIEDHA